MFSLVVNISFDSKDQAKRFFKSVKPEIENEFMRSTTKVAQTDKTLEIKMGAQDKTALRASLNSLLKPLVLFEELENIN